MGFQFIVPRSAFRVSVVEAVEALVEGDELAVRVVESAALDGALDGGESLEGRSQFVVARAAALARFERARGGAASARGAGQGGCPLPLLQVDLAPPRAGGERVQSHGELATPGRDVNRLPHKTSRPPCSIQAQSKPARRRVARKKRKGCYERLPSHSVASPSTRRGRAALPICRPPAPRMPHRALIAPQVPPRPHRGNCAGLIPWLSKKGRRARQSFGGDAASGITCSCCRPSPFCGRGGGGDGAIRGDRGGASPWAERGGAAVVAG